MTTKRIISFIAMAFLFTGSQIPVYLFGTHLISFLLLQPLNKFQGAIPPYIYEDIGGVDRYIWFVLANLLALAAVCPFVGSLSDLIGRRYVALVGAWLLIIGMIVSSSAHNMNIFIGMLRKLLCCRRCFVRNIHLTSWQEVWQLQAPAPVSMSSLRLPSYLS